VICLVPFGRKKVKKANRVAREKDGRIVRVVFVDEDLKKNPQFLLWYPQKSSYDDVR
jgi:hypothetical protein